MSDNERQDAMDDDDNGDYYLDEIWGSDDPLEQCLGCGAHFCEEHNDDCPYLDEEDEN